MSQERELWVNPSSGQRYILPKGIAFAKGDYPISSVSGQRWLVHQKDIQAYAASEAETQLFMMADLRQAIGSAPFLRVRTDDASEDSSDWDSDDSESEDTELEHALTEAIQKGISVQGLNQLLETHPSLSEELLGSLDAELSNLRDQFARMGAGIVSGAQPLTAAAVLRAFGERLIAEAVRLEAEERLSSPSKKEE